jgi:hypothetical protein
MNFFLRDCNFGDLVVSPQRKMPSLDAWHLIPTDFILDLHRTLLLICDLRALHMLYSCLSSTYSLCKRSSSFVSQIHRWVCSVVSAMPTTILGLFELVTRCACFLGIRRTLCLQCAVDDCYIPNSHAHLKLLAACRCGASNGPLLATSQR